MKSLFLALLMCFPVAAQDFNLDNFVPLAEDPIVQPEVVEPVDPIDLGQFDFDAESKARLDEMRRLAEEIRKIGEDLKNSQVTKMTFDDSKFITLEDRVSKLEKDSLNYVTRDEVVGFVKEEVEKQVQLTIKTGNITRKLSVPLKQTSESVVYNQVSIPGHFGTFDVPEGGVITHVDGIPIHKVTSVNNTHLGYTSNHFMQGVKQNGVWRTRIAQPSNCRFVNGVLQCN